MKFVRIDPPGTFLTNFAVAEITSKLGITSFIDVGCGAGGMARQFLRRGMRGTGIDFSSAAIDLGQVEQADYVATGAFRLVQCDIQDPALAIDSAPVDLGYSIMVAEHIEDDQKFVMQIAKHVRPGGYVLVAVPGRRDRWGIEDETVGHLRRYDRSDLESLLRRAGLNDVRVYSAAVPTSNILFSLSNFMIDKAGEGRKKNLSTSEQTKSSGVREIPFKTVFPSFFRILFNNFTMYPLHLLQRLFYGTNLGLTMIGIGRVNGESDVA